MKAESRKMVCMCAKEKRTKNSSINNQKKNTGMKIKKRGHCILSKKYGRWFKCDKEEKKRQRTKKVLV